MPHTALAAHTGIADTLTALVSAEGSATHPLMTGPTLTGTGPATRNLADLMHYLLVMHGRRPDMVTLAASRHPGTAAGRFLDEAAEAFADERDGMARLAVAAGPLPSTPGHAECEAAVAGQAHALGMLAGSDRTGTAFGAAAALLLDWPAIRQVADRHAERLGVTLPPSRLPAPRETLARAATLATGPAIERAIAFGAQQFLFQKRGLLDLLAAREIARRA